VRIGHPRIDPKLFDLVVTTRQYPVPPGGNVVLLPVAMSRFVDPPQPNANERAFLKDAGRFRLVAIGGATKFWTWPVERIVEAVERPFDGSVVAVTSRRTDPAIVERLRALPSIKLIDGASPRFAVLLAEAAEIFVTGDSVSMLSEAVLAGKPVALIPIEQDEKGKRELGPEVQDTGPDARRRDLRRFWNYLVEQDMVGTVNEGPKRAASIPNPNALAAEAVRRLL
jgi:mitochondrial fission protein ELM1